jgi:hypothetical protein
MDGVLSGRSYLAGCAVLIAMFGPLAVAAVRWRQQLLPEWRGVRARLVELVLASSAAVLVAELLGSVGAFRRWPMLAACVVIGGGAAIVARPSHAPTATAMRVIDVEAAIAVAIAAFVAARWIAPMITALRSGPFDADTQTYHLPHAARFFQDGWLTRLYYGTVDDAIPYHPQNGEIFHAYGMLAFGRDIVSPILNIGWLAATLGAAWTIGKRLGNGLLSVTGTAAVLSTPLMVSSQGGTSMTDIVSIFFLLAAVALLLHADGHGELVVIAGLGCGMAVGTKLTVIVPVAVVTAVGFVVAPSLSYERARFAGLWLPPLVLGGAFWYGCNFARVHNPLPAVGLHIGPLSLPHTPMQLIDRYGYRVADYAFDSTIWRKFFVPGLARGFGPTWPIVVAVPLIALVLIIVLRRPPLLRGLGIVGLVGLIAYALTPTTALGLPHRPTLFVGNLRYAVPLLVLGFTLAADVVRAGRRWRWTAVALAVAPLLTGLTRDWEGHAASALVLGVVACGSIVVLAGVRPLSWHWVAAGIAGAIVVAAGGFAVQRSYLTTRYRSTAPDPGAFAWAQNVHHAKIGMAGFFINYPLYGTDLSNRVRYVGDLRADNAFTDYRSCADWRAAVNRGRYTYIVTMPPFPGFPEPPMAQWTRSDPHVGEILHRGRESVFRINGSLDASGCKS